MEPHGDSPQLGTVKSSVSSMVDSVGSLLQRSAPLGAPAPPSALLAPPKPPKPPPATEASGYWTRVRAVSPPPAPSIVRQARENELLAPQTLSPWVLPQEKHVPKSGQPLPEHETQLLGRLLQGLQESSLSVHDVMGVMDLDLRRPGYGDSLAQSIAADANADAGRDADVLAPEPEDACARCRVLERQIKALSQALAGLGARVFNWTVQATIQENQKSFLWDITQQYLQPCAHLDGRLAETCASLAAALRRDRKVTPIAVGTAAAKADEQSLEPRPGASAAPVIEEVLVSFKATMEAKKLNGVYRRRADLQVNGRPVYCNGNRHMLFMADGAWVIKEGPSSEEGAYVYAYVEDPAEQPFAVLRPWQVMDDRDGFVEEREGLVRRNVR